MDPLVGANARTDPSNDRCLGPRGRAAGLKAAQRVPPFLYTPGRGDVRLRACEHPFMTGAAEVVP
jgi:hypothetical protein